MGIRIQNKKAQSAIEYLILATTITIVVLIGFGQQDGFLIQARNVSEEAFNETLRGVLGERLTSNVLRTSVTKSSSGLRGYP